MYYVGKYLFSDQHLDTFFRVSHRQVGINVYLTSRFLQRRRRPAALREIETASAESDHVEEEFSAPRATIRAPV